MVKWLKWLNWLTVRLRTKWLWIRIPLLSLILNLLRKTLASFVFCYSFRPKEEEAKPHPQDLALSVS